jgi:putative ABC transport system substrate-binding protein
MSRSALTLALLLACVAAPLGAEAQQPGRVYRLGFLSMRAGPTDNPQLEAFRAGLRELGYVEGRNVILEIRYADGHDDKLAGLATELVRLNPDVIVAQSGVASLAVRNKTRTIPIVMASSGDAVRQGLIKSLARPGGNVTGLTLLSPELSQKRLEVLREMLPSLSRVGVLWCGGTNVIPEGEWEGTRTASDVLKVRLVSLEAPSARDLPTAFDLAMRQRVEAVLMFDCSSLHPSAVRITELAMKNRLPALYPFSYYPEAGGLMSYGPSVKDAARRAAGYVDRILKGAKPADLPVEQPTIFELVINVKTAKALKLKIPQSLLVRADQVIDP